MSQDPGRNAVPPKRPTCSATSSALTALVLAGSTIGTDGSARPPGRVGDRDFERLSDDHAHRDIQRDEGRTAGSEMVRAAAADRAALRTRNTRSPAETCSAT